MYLTPHCPWVAWWLVPFTSIPTPQAKSRLETYTFPLPRFNENRFFFFFHKTTLKSLLGWRNMILSQEVVKSEIVEALPLPSRVGWNYLGKGWSQAAPNYLTEVQYYTSTHQSICKDPTGVHGMCPTEDDYLSRPSTASEPPHSTFSQLQICY